MRKFKLYVSEMAPNGTRDLIVCDSDDQIKHVVPEAVFGGHFDPEDSMGNVLASFYGESIGMISYSDELYNWDEENQIEVIDEERTLAESILSGENSDIIPVASIKLKQLSEYLACSPVDPDGDHLIEQLKEIGIKLK
jgi:hypothetical protein